MTYYVLFLKSLSQITYSTEFLCAFICFYLISFTSFYRHVVMDIDIAYLPNIITCCYCFNMQIVFLSYSLFINFLVNWFSLMCVRTATKCHQSVYAVQICVGAPRLLLPHSAAESSVSCVFQLKLYPA